MYRMRIKNMEAFVKNYNKFLPKDPHIEWDKLSETEQTNIINKLYSLEKNNRWRDVMQSANYYYENNVNWIRSIELACEDLDIY